MTPGVVDHGVGPDLTEETAEHASGTLSWSSDLCTPARRSTVVC
ncbi:hypothetical protein [Streptomyces sp. NPDC050759]